MNLPGWAKGQKIHEKVNFYFSSIDDHMGCNGKVDDIGAADDNDNDK